MDGPQCIAVISIRKCTVSLTFQAHKNSNGSLSPRQTFFCMLYIDRLHVFTDSVSGFAAVLRLKWDDFKSIVDQSVIFQKYQIFKSNHILYNAFIKKFDGYDDLSRLPHYPIIRKHLAKYIHNHKILDSTKEFQKKGCYNMKYMK